MDLLPFHQRRTALQHSARPGESRTLRMVHANLRDVLVASGLFEKVEVEATADVDRLVIALCTFRPFYTAEDIAFRLENLWSNRVRFPFWEAHAIRTHEGHVEFEAASRTGPDGRYVTVHLVAVQAAIPGQRRPVD